MQVPKLAESMAEQVELPVRRCADYTGAAAV